MPRRSRWTSFVADRAEERPRTLHEEGNPAHRLRVEHDDQTLLIHLSDEDGPGWTCVAIDRPSRRSAVAIAARSASSRVAPSARATRAPGLTLSTSQTNRSPSLYDTMPTGQPASSWRRR